MTRLQRIILALLPPGWRAEAEADSRAWQATCAACGTTTSIWDLGGLRWKGSGNRASGMRCKACGKFGRHDFRRLPQ